MKVKTDIQQNGQLYLIFLSNIEVQKENESMNKYISEFLDTDSIPVWENKS